MSGILVLHPGALGDVVLALPALQLTRRRFPGIQLTVAGSSDYVPAVVSACAERTAALATLPLHRLYSPGLLPHEDALLWNSYDRIISWTGFGDATFERQLRGLTRESVIAGWRPCASETRHMSRIFVESLRPFLGDVPEIPLPIITVAPQNQAAADEWLGARWPASRTVVAVHPGAGNTQKRWHLSGYASLVRALTCSGERRVVIIEGPAEAEAARVVALNLPAERVAVAESLPVGILAGILIRCTGFVGNDSGVSHLAAGLGVPSVVLFGPTSPAIWAPLGRRVEILRDERGCAGCSDPSVPAHCCLGNIRPEAVLDRLTAMLS